jgi:hypothetical protein
MSKMYLAKMMMVGVCALGFVKNAYGANIKPLGSNNTPPLAYCLEPEADTLLGISTEFPFCGPFLGSSVTITSIGITSAVTENILGINKKLIEAKPEALNFLNTGEMQPKLQELLNDSEIQFLNEDGSVANTAEQKAQALVRSVQLIEQQAAQEL